jgi:hypothetical protein
MIHEQILTDFPLILRSELLAQYGSHPAPAMPTVSTSAAPVPATSRSSLPNSSIPDAAVASTSSASIIPAGEEGNNGLADLSLSQIDPGVLAELPAFLQAEIRSHYARGPPAALAAAPPTNSSPAKKLIGKKAAGTLAKRRGRPPKNSVKAPKNTVQKPGKENDAEVANLNNNSKVQHGVKTVVENVSLPEMSEESQSSRDSRSCQTADSQGVGVGGRSPRPTFCGKTSVADIRPLIKVFNSFFH